MTRTLLILTLLAVALPAQRVADRLTMGQRTEPRSFNPVTAADEPSRQIIGLFHATLLRTNPATQQLEPALAESWRAHRNGLEWTAKLRRGLRFSDGRALTAADVAFSFTVFLDEQLAAPQREVLLVEGKPVEVHAVDEQTVRLRLPGRSALGERMLETIPILPRHRLEQPFKEGKLKEAWQLNTSAAGLAGAGPFRLQRHEPGRRLVVERNPHYWQPGEPDLRELEFVFVPTEDSLVARYLAGELDLIAGFGPGSFATLASGGGPAGPTAVQDLGPSLDYTFLLFNLNRAAAAASAKPWLADARFRRAVSLALDRDAMVRLAYRGHATPLWGHVTPARKDWFNPALPRPARSLEQARAQLREAGYRWDGAGRLLSPQGAPVAFTIASSASNPVYGQLAAVIQEDLRQLGMQVSAVALEFRSLIDRVTVKKDFDTAVMALRPGETDPAADLNVLLSSGPTHLWNLGGTPAAWELEMDGLLRRMMSTTDRRRRVGLFHDVQKILAEQLPMVSLASPNILVATRPGLQGVAAVPGGHPALSNASRLRWVERTDASRGK